MDDKYSELFVFLLYSDGTFAWTNADTTITGEPSEKLLGEPAWNRCSSEDKDQIRDLLGKLMLENRAASSPTILHNVEGDRLLVSMDRLPVMQPSQYAVFGWCRRLSDDILKLTNREKEILKLVCEELTTEEIAQQLHISATTVETHRQNISKKLGNSSVVGQVRAAIRGGLIDP